MMVCLARLLWSILARGGGAAADGAAAAARLNACAPRWKRAPPHYTSAVYSARHRFIYFVNYKAGTTAIQQRLESVFERSLHVTDLAFPTAFRAGGTCKRDHKYTSGCFSYRDTRGFAKWSVARDPVAKFESGTRQAWIHSPDLRNYTADDLLHKTLDDGAFADIHLEPSTYAMTGTRRGDKAAENLTFVAKLESLDADWRAVVDAIRPASVSADQRAALLAPLPSVNARPSVARSRLSPGAVRRMCASDAYGDEWRCLGYDLPDVCKAPG